MKTKARLIATLKIWLVILTIILVPWMNFIGVPFVNMLIEFCGNEILSSRCKFIKQSGLALTALALPFIENSPQYFPFFPGEMPTTMKALEFGFRKSIFGAKTGEVIRP